MNTHTQGPWTAEKPGNLWQIYSYGDSMVAQVAHQDVQMDGGRNPEIEEANARLIASAPALLDALRETKNELFALRHETRHHISAETWTRLTDVIERALDATAQATRLNS